VGVAWFGLKTRRSMMRIKSNTLYSRLPPVRLYLDDLLELDELLRKASDKVTWIVMYEAKRYELDGVAELSQLKRYTLDGVEVSIRNPYVSVKVDPTSVFVHVWGDDALCAGLHAQLIRFCRSRRTLPFCFVDWQMAMGLTSLIVSAMFAIVLLLRFYLHLRPTTGQTLYYAATPILVLVFFWLLPRPFRSRIVLKHRVDAPGFFARNYDRIVLAIIGAIAVTGITLLASKLLGGK